ncbi:MAG: TIGR04348 family glycosyltransferase, partial [bacterium]
MCEAYFRHGRKTMKPLDILLVTPVSRDSAKGNRITTDRWERILTNLGHNVTVRQEYDGYEYDLVVAIHARRSSQAIFDFKERNPERPVVLALAGTDLYRDIHEEERARQALLESDYYVTLQPKGHEQLPHEMHERVHVIYQSVSEVPDESSPPEKTFLVSVVGHLREVKDPFRAAKASRLLPDDSTMEIVQIGGALEDEYADEARKLESELPRYHWKGRVSRKESVEWISRSHVTINSS